MSKMTLVDTIDGMSTEKAQAYLDSLERPEEVIAFGEEGEVLRHPDGDKAVKAFYNLHDWDGRLIPVSEIIAGAFEIHERFPNHFVEPIGSEDVNDDWPLGKDLDWSAIRAWNNLKRQHEELFFPPEAKRVFLREKYPIEKRPKYITRLVEWNGPEGTVDPNIEIRGRRDHVYCHYPHFRPGKDGSAPEILRKGMEDLPGSEELRCDNTEDWINAYFGKVPRWNFPLVCERILDAAMSSIAGKTELKALVSEFADADIKIAHPEMNYGLVWVPEEERENYPLAEEDDHVYRLGLDKNGENRIVFFEARHSEEY